MNRRTKLGSFAVATAAVIGIVTAGAPWAGAEALAGVVDTVKAQTTLATLQQTVVIPPGTFNGTVGQLSGKLKGTLALPPASTTVSLAGVGLATATVKLVPTKKVTGKLRPPTPYKVKATSTFNIDVVSVDPVLLPVNLVGSHCATSKPVSLTFSGRISLEDGGTVKGTYTIPPLSNCGPLTVALNKLLAGPGNTFTATLTPTS